MPTYDYVCDGCGHAFELFQSMTDAVKKTCPECGKKKLRRLIGASWSRRVMRWLCADLMDLANGGARTNGWVSAIAVSPSSI